MSADAPVLESTVSPRSLVLVLAAALALFLTSTALVDAGEVGAVELALFHALNGLPHALFWPLWLVMQLGNLVAVPAVSVASLMFRHLRLAAGVLVAGVTGWFLGKLVKDLVGRPRPGALVSDVILRKAHAGGGGYISGHAAIAFALATVLHPYLSRPARVVVWSLAGLVGLARIYVGAHLPLDIVGGAALGISIGLVALLAIRPWRSGDLGEEDDGMAAETS